MTDRVDRILERINTIKLESIEKDALTFRIIVDYASILHVIGFKGAQVGHLIETKHKLSWLPTLRDLELLVDYFTFLRALCEVTCFPSEEAKGKVLDAGKQGEVRVVELCKILYGDQWKDILTALKTFTNR